MGTTILRASNLQPLEKPITGVSAPTAAMFSFLVIPNPQRHCFRGRAQAAKALRRTLRKVDVDRHAIFRRGPRQVGLKSMDIVTELQQQGAFKGFKRSSRG